MFEFNIPFLQKNKKVVSTLVDEDHIVFSRKSPQITGGYDVFAIKKQDLVAFITDQILVPNLPDESIIAAVSDETTPLTTGIAKLTFRMPYAFTLSSVKASLSTASSSGTVMINIKKNGSSIFSTKLTIDVNQKTSVTATTPAVFSTISFVNDDEITVDIDSAGTNATGLKISLIGKQ